MDLVVFIWYSSASHNYLLVIISHQTLDEEKNGYVARDQLLYAL